MSVTRSRSRQNRHSTRKRASSLTHRTARGRATGKRTENVNNDINNRGYISSQRQREINKEIQIRNRQNRNEYSKVFDTDDIAANTRRMIQLRKNVLAQNDALNQAKQSLNRKTDYQRIMHNTNESGVSNIDLQSQSLFQETPGGPEDYDNNFSCKASSSK